MEITPIKMLVVVGIALPHSININNFPRMYISNRLES